MPRLHATTAPALPTLLQDVEEEWPRRTKKQAISLLRRMAEMLQDTSRGCVGRLDRFCDHWSMHPGVPFWLHTPFFDPFKMPPERLHALDSGLVSWFVICLVTLIRLMYNGRGLEINRNITEFDWRFQSIPRFSSLRIFQNGVCDCAKYTAGGEWVDMLKVLVLVVPGLFPEDLEHHLPLCNYGRPEGTGWFYHSCVQNNDHPSGGKRIHSIRWSSAFRHHSGGPVIS